MLSLGERGIKALFVEDELLRSCLALSHASSVVIITGFPTHYMHRYQHSFQKSLRNVNRPKVWVGVWLDCLSFFVGPVLRWCLSSRVYTPSPSWHRLLSQQSVATPWSVVFTRLLLDEFWTSFAKSLRSLRLDAFRAVSLFFQLLMRSNSGLRLNISVLGPSLHHICGRVWIIVLLKGPKLHLVQVLCWLLEVWYQ